MTTIDTTTPASVAGQGAHVALAKASFKKQATARNYAPKPRKSAKGAKPQKSVTTKVLPGSKSAKVLALLARTNGASLATPEHQTILNVLESLAERIGADRWRLYHSGQKELDLFSVLEDEE